MLDGIGRGRIEKKVKVIFNPFNTILTKKHEKHEHSSIAPRETVSIASFSIRKLPNARDNNRVSWIVT